MRKKKGASRYSASHSHAPCIMSLVGLRENVVYRNASARPTGHSTSSPPFRKSWCMSALRTKLSRRTGLLHSPTIVSNRFMRSRHGGEAGAKHASWWPTQMAERTRKRVLKFIRDERMCIVGPHRSRNGLEIPRAHRFDQTAPTPGLAETISIARQRRSLIFSASAPTHIILVPPDASLSTSPANACRMQEFSELGAGFRIAALDLETARRWNMLGSQHHGHTKQRVRYVLPMLERDVSS